MPLSTQIKNESLRIQHQIEARTPSGLGTAQMQHGRLGMPSEIPMDRSGQRR